VLTYALLQLRTRRTIAHRRVFSAAANGLSLALCSVTFSLLRSHLPVLQPGHASQTMAWLAAAAAAAALWYAVNDTLMMTAIRAADPTVGIRSALFTRDQLLNDLCEIGTALVLAASVAGLGWPVLIPALPMVIALHRSFRHAQLVSTARLDAKTGLLNAATWRAEATVQLARAQRAGVPEAVAIADLDHFKAVNDTHGHLAGDAVLAAVAAGFCRQLRPCDLLGRFGGEEFVVFLPGTGMQEAYQIADRLRSDLATHPIAAGEGPDPLHVTVSIGIAAAADPAERDLTDLLAAADNALYTAKTAGRNTVRLGLGMVSS
jgi:diguanylate cyclase (GGDEF)-like protein